jgi:hypothetical protein
MMGAEKRKVIVESPRLKLAAANQSPDSTSDAPVLMKSWFRTDKADMAEFRRARDVADDLLRYLNEPQVIARINSANIPGASSSTIQEVFIEHARNLGFQSECEGLFENCANRALRPDYYLPIGESGILLEVERGKTTINNMDLLDFWKCHLCERANFLFLMVPRELRQNGEMSPRREFNTVSKRMSAFFEPRNYTNVHGLWVFGY